MYLLFELVSLLPLMIYARIQVRKLIPGLGLKRLFGICHTLLVIGYPAAEFLSHSATGPWTRYLILCGYYCLPYLLYITLFVIAIDIVILLAKSIRILPPETISGSGFRFGRLICYLAIPALMVAAGVWNNNRLQIKHLSFELPQRSSTLRELHIVFASDFHLSQITNHDLVEKFVSRVNGLHPDLVLIGGDVIEGDREEDLNTYEAEFRKIRSKYGVYAASGNHERHRRGALNRDSASKFFLRAGMKFVEDGVEKVENAFYLAVRKNGRLSNRKTIVELLKDAPENLPIIVLDHSPTDLENVSNSRADLQFSGHTHNGQLFPMNWLVIPFQYELAWGTKRKGHTIFIVSSGLQAWGPPVKTAGDSELLSVKIYFRSTRSLAIPRPKSAFVHNGKRRLEAFPHPG
jgi:uncharacterized protein